MLNAADKKFLREMIEHHRVAIKMAKMVLKDGTDLEVDGLASAIVEAQGEEIEQIQKLLIRAAYA